MRGNEFLRKIRRLCRDRGIKFAWYPNLGKGSHGILVAGDKRTVVRNLKDELKEGTLHGMLKQLDLTKDDL